MCGASYEEENDGLIIGLDDGDGSSVDMRFAAVGRVVTERSVRFLIFRDVISSMWRPRQGVSMREIGQGRFLFQFYHEQDLLRAIDDGPWSFDQNLVVLERLRPDDNPATVALDTAVFWIQVHQLPVGFISEKVAKVIGGYIGTFISADPTNFDGLWKTFLRIRVRINITKPLKKTMKMKKPGGEWFWPFGSS